MDPAADASPTASEELLVVGRVVAAQGMRGEVRILPLSDFPQRFTQPGPRFLRHRQDPPRSVHLEAGRQLPGKELFVVRFEAVATRDAAEALVGDELLVKASDRPPLQEGEFHLMDLVGLPVRLLDDQGSPRDPAIGTVVDLVHAGNDLLEVDVAGEPGSAGRRLLIPFVAAIVPVVNLGQGWIGLTPPPGLLDL